MNYTENLSLGLPEYGEDADVADLNRNSGILDAYCYNTRQIECEPYDSTKNYMSGDLAIHNEVVYECNTDNTIGAWDNSKWDSTNLAEQIAKAKQSGGGQVTKEASGNPIELTDAANAPVVKCVTAITGYQSGTGTPSPDNIRPIVAYTEGEIEVSDGDGNVTTHTTTYPSAIYRGSDDCVEGEVDSSHLRFTVSSGIELYGNYGDDNAPLFYVDMPEYIITYPRAEYSDDVPISNFYNATTGNSVASMHDFEFRTETPHSGSSAKRVYIRDSRFTTSADFNTFIASNPIQFVFKLATEATSSVTPTNLPIKSLSGYNHIESSTGDLEVQYITKSYQPIIDLIEEIEDKTSVTKTATGNPIELSDSASAPIVKCVSAITGYQSGSGTPSPENVRPIVAYSTGEIDVSDGNGNTTTHTTTYPNAIFRGSEDCVKGEVTNNTAILVFYGTENWQSIGTNPYFYLNLSNDDIYKNNTDICSHFEHNSEISTSNSELGCKVIYTTTANKERIIFRPSGYETMTTTQFKSYLADQYANGTPVTVVVELTTPTTSSVTPTNLPIRTLSGYNHIESTTGDMEVEYITEEYQPLVDLIQSGNGHTYSTQEQVVGKWIDGSVVYEKTLQFTSTSLANTYTSVAHNISNVDIIFIADAFVIGATYTQEMIPYGITQGNSIFSGLVTPSSFDYQVGSDFTSREVKVILRYTKTTQTRSLNAHVNTQKAQIEPLTTEEEEAPTEDEKAVNEEENNDETR